jgi:hypothetical protein
MVSVPDAPCLFQVAWRRVADFQALQWPVFAPDVPCSFQAAWQVAAFQALQ